MRIGPARLLAAIAVAALGTGIAACGEDEATDDGNSSSYAADVEAIMSEQVDPAGITAVDSVTNLAQGSPDVAGVIDELDGVAADLEDARDALAELDPPEEAAVPAEELEARIGVLADRLDDPTPTELKSDPLLYVDNIRTDLDRIENRANQAIEAAEGSSS